jgi:hypothetical protein
LLAQHGDFGPADPCSRTPLGGQRERELGIQTGILGVEGGVERLARALRIVA